MKTIALSLLYCLHLAPRPALTNRGYWNARAELARYFAASIDNWRGPYGVEVSISTEQLEHLALLQRISRYQWGRECDAAAARVLHRAYDTSAVSFPRPESEFAAEA